MLLEDSNLSNLQDRGLVAKLRPVIKHSNPSRRLATRIMSYFVDSLGSPRYITSFLVTSRHLMLLCIDKALAQSTQGEDADLLIEFFKAGLEQDDEEVQAICLNSLLFMLNICTLTYAISIFS